MSVPKPLKITAIVGAFLFGLVMVMAAVYIVRVVSAGQRVEKEIARLRAEGHPVSMTDWAASSGRIHSAARTSSTSGGVGGSSSTASARTFETMGASV